MSDLSDTNAEEDALRVTIAQALQSQLQTEIWPRADTSEMVNTVVARLRAISDPTVNDKLIIAGFTDYTVSADDLEQPCETCMYYLTHRKFCNLPELMLPVEPEWSCRLWRI